MKLPPNLYAIKFEDLQKGMTIYTDDNEHGYGLSEFNVISKSVTNNIATVVCLNVELEVEQEIKINLRQPRDLYSGNVASSWKRV